MTFIQSLLAFVQKNRIKSGFNVSSIWVQQKTIVLESDEFPIDAKRSAEEFCKALKFSFPNVVAELSLPDADGTTLTLNFEGCE